MIRLACPGAGGLGGRAHARRGAGGHGARACTLRCGPSADTEQPPSALGMRQQGWCAGPILSTGDIMREEQYHARGMFHEVTGSAMCCLLCRVQERSCCGV